ncbi:hypothetical protein H5410_007278 [Solanum commersonii]|uniref:Uncharacterized protein n=1 Tax=Solanum commersonii TaxID=4109 RepID=A0A9J6ACM5_SOLCO|nr:hypothetical protein H5410_007278 [Solanum commersonii]
MSKPLRLVRMFTSSNFEIENHGSVTVRQTSIDCYCLNCLENKLLTRLTIDEKLFKHLTTHCFLEMRLTRKELYINDLDSQLYPQNHLQGKSLFKNYCKMKSDFTHHALMIWNPYGGMMAKISESETPFPYRKF